MSKVIKTEIDSKRISAQMDQRVRKGRMMLKSEIARDCSSYLPFENGLTWSGISFTLVFYITAS